jgi:P pilus assembly chaperone PapD
MDTSNDKKFTLRLDKQGKIFYAEVHGSFKPEDANAFVTEYTQNVNSINPTEYELNFDSTKLKVNTQDMVPMLAACFEMYDKAGYRRIVFDCSGNPTLKMQINRVAKMTGLKNYELVG